MLRTSSRTHTFVYATLMSIVLICSTIHLSSYLAQMLDPNDPSNMVYMSVLVSGILAPPASFMLAIYSNRLIKVQEQLHELAIKDPLTGLLNRRAFEASFDREMARAQRTNQKMSLLLFDLDHFKAINEKHGHEGGDIVLRNLAECLRTTIRFGTDEAGRWGGEEFTVLLTDTDHRAAMVAANRFRERVQALNIQYGGKEVSLTASIGVVECQHGQTLEQVVKRADRCLRRAKKSGRNTIVGFPQAVNLKVQA